MISISRLYCGAATWKPHQGTAVVAVCRSDQRRQDESESDPALFFFGCLHVDAGIATPWIEGHTDGNSTVQHNPAEAAQSGSQVKVTVRKVWVSLAGGYPYADLFYQVFRNIQATTLRC
jgi:hypothetical protein